MHSSMKLPLAAAVAVSFVAGCATPGQQTRLSASAVRVATVAFIVNAEPPVTPEERAARLLAKIDEYEDLASGLAKAGGLTTNALLALALEVVEGADLMTRDQALLDAIFVEVSLLYEDVGGAIPLPGAQFEALQGILAQMRRVARLY